MPWGLKRYQQAHDLHFVTFSCYRRQPLLAPAQAKSLFQSALERTRLGYRFYVVGYVVMPEHVHLLVSEPQRSTLCERSASYEAVGGPKTHWPPRALLAGTLLRLQRMDGEEVDREAVLPASQPGYARTGGQAGRLAVEQFPALLDGRRGRGGDRVGVDGKAQRADRDAVACAS